MQRLFVRGLAVCLSAGLLIGSAQVATADPNPPDGGKLPPVATKSVDSSPTADELPNPQEEKRRALREEALKLVLNGERKVQRINGADVVKVGKQQAPLTRAEQAKVRAGQRVARRMVDQYVELSREDTDQIFVVLAEFGTQRDPRFPDRDTDPTTLVRSSSTARCTTPSRNRTGRSTTPPSGRPTSTPTTTGISTSARPREHSRSSSTTRGSRRAGIPWTGWSPTG